jgi:hypothetical protein
MGGAFMNKEIKVSSKILRKLEGRTGKWKHIKGYIEILDEHQMEPVEFFIWFHGGMFE